MADAHPAFHSHRYLGHWRVALRASEHGISRLEHGAICRDRLLRFMGVVRDRLGHREDQFFSRCRWPNTEGWRARSDQHFLLLPVFSVLTHPSEEQRDELCAKL